MAMVNSLMVLEACDVITREEYMTIRVRIINYDAARELEHLQATGQNFRAATNRKSKRG